MTGYTRYPLSKPSQELVRLLNEEAQRLLRLKKPIEERHVQIHSMAIDPKRFDRPSGQSRRAAREVLQVIRDLLLAEIHLPPRLAPWVFESARLAASLALGRDISQKEIEEDLGQTKAIRKRRGKARAFIFLLRTINSPAHLPQASFTLDETLALIPSRDEKRPAVYLWALSAFLIQDMAAYPDRLKRCQHVREGIPCPFLFWDKAKNKSRIYCDDTECRNDRNQEKVRKCRADKKKEERHGKIRTKRPRAR